MKNKPAQLRKHAMRASAVVLLAGSLSACTATYRNHGYVPTEDELAEVVVGIDTRDSVAESVGTPSSGGVLNDSGYYYVRSRVRHTGLRAPEVIERELVAISFSETGVVENIERFGLQDGRTIRLTRRVTESSISNRGFLRQLLGNLGNFSPEQFTE